MEAVQKQSIWDLKANETSNVNFKHVVVLGVMVIVGTILGTYGSMSVPVEVKQYLHVSGFWPGQAVQSVGCVWFGMWGVIASFFFPFISNMISGQGGIIISIAFLPANLTQGLLAGWAFRHFKADPCLRDGRSWVIWIVFGCLLANLIGAAWGTTMLVFSGTIPQESQLTAFIGWVIGNSFPTLVLGSIVLWFGSPLVIKLKVFCKGYWS